MKVFIHIGLHRTGTTFLQKEVFPLLPGVDYLYKPLLQEVINYSSFHNKLLISDEGLIGRIWNAERNLLLQRLYNLFPEASIIVGFRKHNAWIRSTYSLYLRRGGTLTVDQFIQNDNEGILKRRQLEFAELINQITQLWENPPFIYLMEEIQDNPMRMVGDLCKYMALDIADDINFNSIPRNPGLNQKQQLFCKKLNKYVRSEYNPIGLFPVKIINKLGLQPERLSRLWFKKDDNKLNEEWAITEKDLFHFTNDWNKVINYSMKTGRSSYLKKYII